MAMRPFLREGASEFAREWREKRVRAARAIRESPLRLQSKRINIMHGREGGDGAVRDGGGELADVLTAAVARDEDAGGCSDAVLAGIGVAARIEGDEVFERAVLRHVADGDEDALHREGAAFAVLLDDEAGVLIMPGLLRPTREGV